MNDDPKQAMEELIAALFKEILNLARSQNISVKQMREMLPVVQIRALAEEGLNQQEIMAESGYTRKWIREILAETPKNGSNNPIDQFVCDWDADPNFPDQLPLEGKYPSFMDLHDRYGGDFTAPGLIKILKTRNIISECQGQITLDPARKAISTEHVDMIRAAQASLTALCGTLNHNLLNSHDKFMERRIWSSTIPNQKLSELRDEINEINSTYRKRVMEALIKHQIEPGRHHTEYAPPVGIGLYWYQRNNP